MSAGFALRGALCLSYTEGGLTVVFIGDIASPYKSIPYVDSLPRCFSEQPVVANLEGAIVSDTKPLLNKAKLFNSTGVLDMLRETNVKVVSLANNHITDVPEAIPFTLDALAKEDVLYCGAGNSAAQAARPAILNDNGSQYAFLAFGWDAISCRYVKNGKWGVNPLKHENVIKCIADTRGQCPNAKIILLLHWDYELEKYPMPMHRILAKKALDAGADAIFGHHPHCVQGIEFYKQKPIVYSLGNWYIAHGGYNGGRGGVYPEYAHLQLAVEYMNERLICHWFEFVPQAQKLRYISSEDAESSARIKELTPFASMDDIAYAKWFHKNRAKKKCLPVYKSIDARLENALNDVWVRVRQKCINFLVKCRLK